MSTYFDKLRYASRTYLRIHYLVDLDNTKIPIKTHILQPIGPTLLLKLLL